MRVTSTEETLQSKEAYKRLTDTHKYRLCTLREDNGRFSDPLLKELFQTCRQNISKYVVVSHHQNKVVDHRIKELTLVSWTLLLHTTRLYPESVSTILWNLPLNTA